MAVWYVSSVNYAAVSAFAISTAYTVGNLVRAISPTENAKHVFRCTTAGTSAGSEPSWSVNNNATTTSGTAVFTCVSGQSTYGWSAAAGVIAALDGGSGTARLTAGDSIYVGQDHSETYSSSRTFGGSSGYSPVQVICVDRSGSVPPVSADMTTGASIATSSSGNITWNRNWLLRGVTVSSASNIYFESTGGYGTHSTNCTLVLNNATSGSVIGAGLSVISRIVWENTTVQFGHTGQRIGGARLTELNWTNTASAIAGATIPTMLFQGGTCIIATLRGVDVSAISGNITESAGAVNAGQNRILLDGCKIASGVTLMSPSSPNYGATVELVNCYDGTNIRNERATPAGTVTTERTIVRTGGASDAIGGLSLKFVSSANLDRWSQPLEGFHFDVHNAVVGSSITATIEIVSSASLNDNDVYVHAFYDGTASSSVKSKVTNAPDILATGSAITTSTSPWASAPGTPVYQKITVTFTPQHVGRVRFVPMVGKASTTVYIDPKAVFS